MKVDRKSAMFMHGRTVHIQAMPLHMSESNLVMIKVSQLFGEFD